VPFYISLKKTRWGEYTYIHTQHTTNISDLSVHAILAMGYIGNGYDVFVYGRVCVILKTVMLQIEYYLNYVSVLVHIDMKINLVIISTVMTVIQTKGT
jgi:hypothetical protein